MPIAAITILYNVTSMPARLVLVATFTVAFTFLCGTLTAARAIDSLLLPPRRFSSLKSIRERDHGSWIRVAAVQVVLIGTSPGRG